MTERAHLWVLGFDTTSRAAEVRDEITKLAWEKHCLILRDAAVVVRCADGTLTLNGDPFPVAIKIPGGTIAHLLFHLALGAPPLSGSAVGTMMSSLGSTAGVGISDEFVRKVAQLLKPGSSALFVLDEAQNMDAILHAIRGLGGTVLSTNVDMERAQLIQATLSASADTNA
jgi:uncharacterized membrane protein